MSTDTKFTRTFTLLLGLSNPHLGAISHFASEASMAQEKFEQAVDPDEGMTLMQLVQSYSLGAIICSWSFLEAHINDFFGRCVMGNQLVEGGILTETEVHVVKMFATSPSFDKLETLAKYAEALRLTGKQPLDMGKEPYQSINQIRRFRNTLVHYKHESSEEYQKEKKSLLNVMKERHIEPILDNEDFPDSYLTSKAASWAAKSSSEFFMTFVLHLTH